MRANSASLLAFVAITAPAYGWSSSLQKILADTNNPMYQYPTDLTRNIVPKQFHSHNDYWRDLPFYSALSYGAISVEADVSLVNGTLLVGHEQSALTSLRTFQSLYINPILDTLKKQNPTTPYVDGSSTKNGVYDTDSGQTLYLFVDVKTDGASTWPVVLSQLSPLLDAGYLSTTDGKTFNSGPVTVVGTGNTPFNYFSPVDPASPSSPRFAFYDGPLATLSSSNITSLISPIASTDFAASFGNVRTDGYGSVFNSSQLATLRAQIGEATKRGILARYWDQPGWPIGVRNAVWRALWEEGTGLVNVDDLEAAAKFWEERN